MSPGRSPSGVASLRARFEHNQQDTSNTSPPSRGRSPSGSVVSDGPRPLSKVRTSFVSVEPSGQMASTLQVPSLDGAEMSKLAPKVGSTSKSQMNGHATMPTANNPNANPDAAVSAADNTPAGMAPADPKNDSAIPHGDAQAELVQGLGSILKGSPFESEKSNKIPAQKPVVTKSQPTRQLKKTAQAPSGKPAATTQQPKQLPQKPNVPGPAAAPKAPQPLNSEPTTIVAPQAHGKTKNTPGKKIDSPGDATTVRPVPVLTGTKSAVEESAKRDVPIKASPNAQPAPRSPSTTMAPAKESPAKANPSKPTTMVKDPKKSPTQPKTATTKASDRLGAVAKAPIAAAKAALPSKTPASSSSTGKATKKPGVTSTKPRPKSPTQPVRLPTAATASTAASAAKHDTSSEAPPSRSPSRTGNASTIKKPGAVSHPKNPRTSIGIRASLPAGTKTIEHPRAKPRTSLAGTKAPEDSFLSRMMRPTQSSAQKTHEKTETKSPPRKTTHVTRPKRKSEESAGSNSKSRSEGNQEGPTEQSPSADTREEPKVEAAIGAIDPLPLTDPSARKNDIAAEEKASTAPVQET